MSAKDDYHYLTVHMMDEESKSGDESNGYDGDTESSVCNTETSVSNTESTACNTESSTRDGQVYGDDKIVLHVPNSQKDPSGKKSRDGETDYPEEKCKTLSAAVMMLLSFVMSVAALCVTHEKLPDKSKYHPLPDIVLDLLPEIGWALYLSEFIIIFCIVSVLVLVVLHQYTYIVFRRIFLMITILYLYRSLTMFVTVLPVASRTYHCADQTPKLSLFDLTRRVFSVLTGLGLSVNGKHVYCGDFIYSGHTVMFILTALIVGQYSPKRWWWLHWFYWILAASGITLLELSHGHYTIDVIVAYFVTTRLFWFYHMMADNDVFKEPIEINYLSRTWWYVLFRYFEKNVKGPVPNEYRLPFKK